MAKRGARAAKSGKLFAEPQADFFEKSAQEMAEEVKRTKGECLGLTFENESARRAHFHAKLREKLADPNFRSTPDFPTGTDDDILRLSDPPWYTACPNPFLRDFVRVYGRPYEPLEGYEREPFAVDTSVGKTDALYKAHGYHTKVPHLAIVPSILHYTNPGDLVLDGFCGSGMTGVAAQWCGTAPKEYRQAIEAAWAEAGRDKPLWGARHAILGDLGPAATFIAAGYNLPFNAKQFAAAATQILEEVADELGWMYETIHSDGKTKGRINFTVWSEVFTCPECAGEVVFVREALDPVTKTVAEKFPCPHCRASLSKDNLDRYFESLVDPATNEPCKRIRLLPVMINYSVDGRTHEKDVDAHDLEVLDHIRRLSLPPEVPTNRFPIETMAHGSRIAPKGLTNVHHFYLPRAAQALATLWRKASAPEDVRLRNALLFFVEQAIWNLTILNAYRPTGFSQNSQWFKGVYYAPSQHAECSPWYVLAGKQSRLTKVFSQRVAVQGSAIVTTGDCAAIPTPSDSVDYIFTDPPFGENIYYADLNFLVESWHGVLTQADGEAIVDRAKKKKVHEYQDLMRRCFEEYFRVLKPGRWMTVVFSNSANVIWRAIQEGMGTAGFVVADVRTLDKQQGSYRQVTSSAVKQDLVISAYKPSAKLEKRFKLGEVTPENCWSFVEEHLRNLPVFAGDSGEGEVLVERTPQMLHDRMIAFHVQRGVAVPMGSSDFLSGLERRYPERDGMYFLPEQVSEYDRKRVGVKELRQLSLFVNDEASAIQWVRQQLQQKPQLRQDLTPQFTKEIHAWAKHEATVDLKDILEQNFLCYEGKGPVPSQIHSYLSTNYKECRKLEKDAPELVERASGRWYVADAGKLGDLERIRSRKLLAEFEGYKASKDKKLKQFRTEAIRAGFKAAYDAQDYATIVAIAAKIPESVLQEDEKLLMYYDVAATRLGN